MNSSYICFCMATHPFTFPFLAASINYEDRPAICAGTDSYSYKSLRIFVGEVMQLILRDASNEETLAVADQNDVFTYAALLAINLLGKTAVPLNLHAPEVRNRAVLQAAGVRTILSSNPLVLSGFDVIDSRVSGESRKSLPEPVDSSQAPAYILFTSGSTGTPKGVPVSNGNLNAFFNYFLTQPAFHFGPEDRFLQTYDITFDVSVFCAFTPLFSGGCLCLLPRKGFTYLEIPQVLASAGITVLSMVPSTLHYLQPHFSSLRFEKLRLSFFSGDRLLHSLTAGWSQCVPHARIFNCYGPTETTIVCTSYEWKEKEAAADSFQDVVPIGKPFPGMVGLIETDSETDGGELCLSGEQVIKSYLHGVRKEQFFESYKTGSLQVFYRTGDRVKKNKNGDWLFLGRTDQQLKINGYRIEPGEVEEALRQVTGNRMCAVAGMEGPAGLQVMYAFTEGDAEEHLLLSALRALLPAPFIPKRIIAVEKMPLNSNGKIDRQELRKFV